MQENQNGANRGEGEENPHTSAEKLNQTAQNAAAETPEKAVKADAAAPNSAQNAAAGMPEKAVKADVAAAENSAQNAAENAPNGAQKTPETAAKVSETAPQGGQGNGQSAAVLAADEPDLRYKNKKEVAKGGVLGFFIGLAVIVPGVSGSAVAIIFRLYDKLLYALGNILKKFGKCLRFLLPVGIGLVIGFVLGFFAVQKLIDLVPFIVIGLFAGLMLGAFPAVSAEIKGEKKTPARLALFLAGLAVPVAFGIVSTLCVPGGRGLENLQFYHYILFLVLGAAVAVTQIVPGLSASALLMMAGYFSALMDSVHLSYWQQNPAVFGVYACLVVGFLAGLIGFSKALSSLLSRRRVPSFFAICGLSLGSVITMFFNPDVFAVYQSWASGGVEVLDLVLGILLFFAGAACAYLFVRKERNKNKLLQK